MMNNFNIFVAAPVLIPAKWWETTQNPGAAQGRKFYRTFACVDLSLSTVRISCKFSGSAIVQLQLLLLSYRSPIVVQIIRGYSSCFVRPDVHGSCRNFHLFRKRSFSYNHGCPEKGPG